jgi:hypothetical protein
LFKLIFSYAQLYFLEVLVRASTLCLRKKLVYYNCRIGPLCANCITSHMDASGAYTEIDLHGYTCGYTLSTLHPASILVLRDACQVKIGKTPRSLFCLSLKGEEPWRHLTNYLLIIKSMFNEQGVKLSCLKVEKGWWNGVMNMNAMI